MCIATGRLSSNSAIAMQNSTNLHQSTTTHVQQQYEFVTHCPPIRPHDHDHWYKQRFVGIVNTALKAYSYIRQNSKGIIIRHNVIHVDLVWYHIWHVTFVNHVSSMHAMFPMYEHAIFSQRGVQQQQWFATHVCALELPQMYEHWLTIFLKHGICW